MIKDPLPPFQSRMNSSTKGCRRQRRRLGRVDFHAAGASKPSRVPPPRRGDTSIRVVTTNFARGRPTYQRRVEFRRVFPAAAHLSAAIVAAPRRCLFTAPPPWGVSRPVCNDHSVEDEIRMRQPTRATIRTANHPLGNRLVAISPNLKKYFLAAPRDCGASRGATNDRRRVGPPRLYPLPHHA